MWFHRFYHQGRQGWTDLRPRPRPAWPVRPPALRFHHPRPRFRFDGFRNPSIFSMDSESCWIIFSFLRIANPAEKFICQNIAGLKFNVWGEFPDGFFKMKMFPKTEQASIQRHLNCCNICNFLSYNTISDLIARQEHFAEAFSKMCLPVMRWSYQVNLVSWELTEPHCKYCRRYWITWIGRRKVLDSIRSRHGALNLVITQ